MTTSPAATRRSNMASMMQASCSSSSSAGGQAGGDAGPGRRGSCWLALGRVSHAAHLQALMQMPQAAALPSWPSASAPAPTFEQQGAAHQLLDL